MTRLLDELASLQQEVINIVSCVDETDYYQQFHPDLSPIGWHLGHCVYIESYWIQEQLLNNDTDNTELKSLYVPELSIKKKRGAALPDKGDLIKWANTKQSENLASLNSAINNALTYRLLEQDFLLHFLIQHYSQHIETMYVVLTEMQLNRSHPDITINNPLSNRTPTKTAVKIETGCYEIGSDNPALPYDNEHPKHLVELNQFKIATHPISNAEYLGFMDDNGYTNKHYWSEAGWQWLQENTVSHPHHWHQQDNNWFGISHQGPYVLDHAEPVHGLNYYEAQAYANWVGGRLPHEYEWEIAYKRGALEKTASVWEWCHNTFHAYQGFIPFPYEGYSKPYFDEQHYVIRGGSKYTKEAIKRASFRNYYTANKRHIFAGLRIVYD